MSRGTDRPDFTPMIALAEKSARVLRADMLRHAHEQGFGQIQAAHNAVFATLPPEGARSASMAARAGITRQSMGEAIRDMVGLGLLEMVPDPTDGRAKVVVYTEEGLRVARAGYQRIVDLDRLLRDAFGDADVDATCRVLAGIVEMFDDLSP